MSEQKICSIVKYCNVTWQVEFSLLQFIQLIHHIQEVCPNLSLLSQKSLFVERLKQIESGSQDSINGLSII